MTNDKLDEGTRTAIEAAVFRRLLRHLDAHKEVQNIDLMITADFCRNCLSKWYVAAAAENGQNMDLADAHQAVYGMSYAAWKAHHQTPASQEQLDALAARQADKSAGE
ncbi:MAG: DUF1244 domain-containing protein [Gammaproteobacteria bacterium]|nr:DUF1244 domain-containing protein [Gammaproteobacteria bacterium]